MKLSGRKLCSALLSVSIIASSFSVSVYAGGKKNFIPKVTAIDSYDNPTFVIGELSEKSGDSAEKVVEKNYNNSLKGSGNLKQKSFKQNKRFKNSMGRTVISTTQTYNGFPVYGTDQNFHINDDGVIECVSGSKVNDIESKLISGTFSAKYTQKDVLNTVEKHLGFKPDYESTPKPEIILYPVSGIYHYVYEVNIKCVSPYYKDCTYYVDASNMSIINVNNHILASGTEQEAVGKGTGHMNKTRQLEMVKDDDNIYYLKNLNEKFGTHNSYWDRIKSEVVVGALFSEADNNFDSGTSVFCQEDAVDAHYNVTKVSKFFSSAPFYRDGNDGEGSDIIVCVVTNSRIPNAYGGKNYIEFHPGHGSVDASTAYCLDIAAHEFTHGILYSEGLGDQNHETEALHEGVADVFGVLAEYFIPNDYTESPFLWMHGEDYDENARNCEDPEIDDYNDYLNTENVDSHEGGGVITKAACLMAKGGNHNGITVNALGYGKLARIFYNTINDGYITKEMTFRQFANFAIQSASLLYGINSQAYRSTRDAFTAVGLFSAPPTDLRLIYVSDMKVQLMWNAEADKRVGIFRKGAGTRKEPVWVKTTTSTIGEGVNTLPGSCDFYVAYVDEFNNRTSAYSNAINIQKLTKSAPANFRMTYRSGTSIQFSWSGTTGDKFAIYRKISGTNDEFVKLDETTNKQMSVETLLGKCEFKVAVVSSDEDGIRLSPFSNVVTIDSYQGAPANFKLDDSTSSTAKFSWDEAAANRYAVYRVRPGTLDTPVKVAETRETSLRVYTTSGTYDYQVAIVDLEGNRISSFSNIVPVTK